MATNPVPSSLHGVMAQFDNLESLIVAAKQITARGYRKVDAYSPIPSEELAESLAIGDNILPKLVFIGGLTGVTVGFSMQYIASVWHYPWIVGGKPYNSWPTFIPVSYELMILFAALTAAIGMFAINGLPMLYHPVFNIQQFEKAS